MKLTDLFPFLRRGARPAGETAAEREVARAARVRDEAYREVAAWRQRPGPAGALIAARNHQGGERRD